MVSDRPARDSENWETSICNVLIRHRRVIGTVLDFSLVENANWDMLLELYLARCERRQVFAWSLCAAANAPYSTAHRKLRELADNGWILRHEDMKDRRRVEVELTAMGAAKLEAIVKQIADVGWPPRQHDQPPPGE